MHNTILYFIGVICILTVVNFVLFTLFSKNKVNLCVFHKVGRIYYERAVRLPFFPHKPLVLYIPYGRRKYFLWSAQRSFKAYVFQTDFRLSNSRPTIWVIASKQGKDDLAQLAWRRWKKIDLGTDVKEWLIRQ